QIAVERGGFLLSLRLNGDGASHRLNRAGELCQERIAIGSEQPPRMLRDIRLDYLVSKRTQPLERVRLVGVDQAGIARYVGDENCGEAARQPGSPRRCRLDLAICSNSPDA